MKKALLVVSFGTSHMDTMEKTIFAFENAMREAFPERQFYRAFTSRVIARKLKREGLLEVDSVEEAMERILAEGYEDLLVQPSHILHGEENDRFCAVVEKYQGRFAKLVCGKPMLSKLADYEAVVEILQAELPEKAENRAIVLLGHGTEHPANATYGQLSYMLYDQGREDILVGTVEGYPAMPQVRRRLQEMPSVKRVDLYPFLFVAGDHAKNDMAGDEPDSWKSQLISLGYEVHCHLKGFGEYPQVHALFVKHAQNAE